MKPLDTRADAPWRQRFRVPKASTQLASSDPTRGLAVSNHAGIYQLYAWDVPTGALRQLTDRSTGQARGELSGDGRSIYYLNDDHGNELGHYVRIPYEGGEPQDITPGMERYASLSFSTSGDGRRFGFTSADDEGFHTYTLPIESDGTAGSPRLVFESRSLTYGPALSHAGDLAVVETTEGAHGLNFRLRAFDTATGALVGELSDGQDSSVWEPRFARLPGDARVLASTNRSGVTRPLIWEARAGTRTDLDVGELEGDIEPQDWSPDGQQILLRQTFKAIERLYLYDLATGAIRPLASPAGTYGSVYFGPDGEIFAHWESATQPPQLIALDRASGAQLRTVLAGGTVPQSRPWRSVSFRSSDGQEIQAWLGLPDGDGPFPTILETHGGPTWVMKEYFSAGAQAWLDHGFAFLTINYRGSTTFGRDFERKIWYDLGHWEVDDMAAARDWLVREGIADPEAILLTGWSYGGYLTLMGLGKLPRLWAGGMAGIAIADWRVQYEDTADTLKGYQVALLGGTPDEQPERYAAASPITYAEQVRAPVLVIQGSNDTRCPARPMHNYEAKMRALGKDIEVEWFEAGHGSYDVEQSIEHQERMLRFAYRVLG